MKRSQQSHYQGEKFEKFMKKVRKDPSKYNYQGSFTVADVAEKLGVTPGAIYGYYKSERLKIETVEKIEEIFGVSREHIWGDAPAAPIEYVMDYNLYIVPRDVFGNFLQSWNDYNFLASLQKESFFFIKGDAYMFESIWTDMGREFLPGNWIITTTVNDHKALAKGQRYIFQTDNEFIFKVFDRIEGNTIYAVSEGGENEIAIETKSVVNIFLGRLVVSNI